MPLLSPAALAQNQDDHLRLNHGVYFDNRPIYLFAAEERVGARLDGEKPRSSSSCAALSRRHRLQAKPTAVPTTELKPTGVPTTTELKPTAVPTVEAKKPTAVPTTQEL